MTDEQIIELCQAAGIKWIPPELPDDYDYEMGFPGSFDMVSMSEMRALLAACLVTPERPSPISISTDQIAEIANKYALGNPRLDALRCFVNEVIIVNGAEYAKSE